jgi:hypothetical protein
VAGDPQDELDIALVIPPVPAGEAPRSREPVSPLPHPEGALAQAGPRHELADREALLAVRVHSFLNISCGIT